MTGSKLAIIGLEFVERYPLLVSIGSGGTICIYTTRGAPLAIRNFCIGRFLNLGFNGEEYVNVGLTSMFLKLYENPEMASCEQELPSATKANTSENDFFKT